MLVEVVEEVGLLRLVDGGEHVLGVEEVADDVHELDGTAHLRIRVAGHLLDDDVHEE